MEFNNERNKRFYEKIPEGTFEKYAKISGIEDALELDIVESCFSLLDASSVLEIGAGNGRVVSGLLERGFSGVIHVIERCPRLVSFLRDKFRQDGVKFYQIDILNDELPKAEYGLWLWAGIGEFNAEEQRRVVNNVANSVSKGMVIDVVDLKSKTNATTTNGQYLEIDVEGNKLRCYVPSGEDIRSYAENSNLDVLKAVHYETSNGRERDLYFLRKR